MISGDSAIKKILLIQYVIHFNLSTSWNPFPRNQSS